MARTTDNFKPLIYLPSGERAIEVLSPPSCHLAIAHSSNGRDRDNTELTQTGQLHDACRVTVLVPTKDNGRIQFSPLRFLGFEQFLRSIPTGFTRRGLVFGSWFDDENRRWVDDESVEYFCLVATESDARTIAIVVTDYIKHAFKQREVLVSITKQLTTLQLAPLQLTPEEVEA